VSHLMSYSLCCVVRADHPRIGDELTLDAYLKERHAVLTFGSSAQPLLTERMIDSVLAQYEAKRKIAFYVPSFLALIDIVSKSDLLGIIPLPLAQEAARHQRLRYFEPPIELPDQNSVMVWHGRTKRDPGHKWLRSMLRRAMQVKANKQPKVALQFPIPQRL
ncbi:MAG TPA: LysR substrate-binding domain-containing protein, partial [Caulobacteraceae bacterium]|nr:LysR substrate-binding domain-containing protein [Caulobacteraceae bacterium]